jgi:hypothetical protein
MTPTIEPSRRSSGVGALARYGGCAIPQEFESVDRLLEHMVPPKNPGGEVVRQERCSPLFIVEIDQFPPEPPEFRPVEPELIGSSGHARRAPLMSQFLV